MKIKGLQKLTVIDYPGKIGCTIFLFGCNFCCGFCHNPELVLKENEKTFPEEEILEFLEERKKYLEGICITGGEPLLSLEKDFLKKIKSLGYFVKIDTNGCFPDKLRNFIEEGLVDFVSIDIKSSKENYHRITNSEVDLSKIEESLKIISELKDYEFRTTVIKGIHDVEEMKKIISWVMSVIGKKPKKFCLQGFKNKGKIIENTYKMKKDVHEEYLRFLKEEIKDFSEDIEIRF